MPRLFLLAALALLLVVAAPPRQTVEAYDVCIDDGACIHEYMAEQGIPLYSNSEINEFFEFIRAGATDEDVKDHVFDYTWVADSLVTITHFWDADAGPDDPVENSISDFSLLDEFPNGWQKVRAYWSMALGAYAKGDRETAYHMLGHIVHQLGDSTLPTHVKEDMHFPDDDALEDWMSKVNACADCFDKDKYPNAGLTVEEKAQLIQDGLIEYPVDVVTPFDKLYYLMYQQNQVADYFASDDYNGDTVDPEGWMTEIYAEMTGVTRPRLNSELVDNDKIHPDVPDLFNGGNDYDNDVDGDLSIIREWSYLRGIRTIATVYKLFADTVSEEKIGTLVVQTIRELDDHDFACTPGPLSVCTETSNPDFYVRTDINGFVSQNRGDEIEDDADEVIDPFWAFGAVVGATGTIPVTLQVWDHDGAGDDIVTLAGDDDHSNATSAAGRSISINVDLAACIGETVEAITGSATGLCNQPLTPASDEDDDDDDDGISRVTFKFFIYQAVDTDGDGLVDQFDDCDDTPAGRLVDSGGCDDRDGDGVTLADDYCPESAPGATVVASGCSVGDLTPDECIGMNFSNVIVGAKNANLDARGSAGTDLIVSFGNALTVQGLGGNDCIVGSEGDDNIVGGPGADVILGRGGNDTVDGGTENDYIDGGIGNDVLKGGNGNDHLIGGEGNDNLDGGNNNDLLEGGIDNDVLVGGNGDDTLSGDEGNDSLDGGNNNDRLDGGPDIDQLNGRVGTDRCSPIDPGGTRVFCEQVLN